MHMWMIMVVLPQPHKIMWVILLCCYCVFMNTLSTLHSPIYVGENSMHKIRVDDTNFLVKVEVESMWVQDHGFPLSLHIEC